VTLKAKLLTQVQATLTNPLDLSTPVDALDYTIRHTLTSGTGDNQADLLWHDERTLSGSANESLDLSGSLVNAFGVAQSFVKVKAIAVAAELTNTTRIILSRPANGANLFEASGDAVSIYPGGIFFWASPGVSGVSVTNSSADLININNVGAGSATYEIVVIGTSA
jgi:hypothetical protein